MQEKTISIKSTIAQRAHIKSMDYESLYRQSIEEPDRFWSEQASSHLDWCRKWDRVSNVNFADAEIAWFEGGQLNVSYNCIDRHLEDKGDQLAIIWEGDDKDEVIKLTYKQLYKKVCAFANGLKSIGVGKGDRVCLYMPMVPEALIAMLACTRIGAVHTIVFGGFSPEALRGRINDCECKVVITAEFSLRGGKQIPLKQNVDQACLETPSVEYVVTCPGELEGDRAQVAVQSKDYSEISLFDLLDGQSEDSEPEVMDSEDPLFILYTSGSTGAPKGVLHTCAGYLLYSAMTFKYVFDYQEGEVFWCTADVGWITGHSYACYGPLANGATTLIFEGVPNYPDASRFWQIVDRHQVNIFYTAPTALRSLMGAGEEYLETTKRDSLRVLGTVGEPINPEVWDWYHDKVGNSRCPVVDTWWQTETGGVMIAPLPGAIAAKPGSATLPFFGVSLELMDDKGVVLDGEASGNLVISGSWPGQMRGIYKNQDRFKETYFSTYPGYYFTGDGCKRDADGYFWITGRVDDVINVSGHRMGTAEIESALVQHKSVAEAAVVGCEHEIKGQGIYAYVTLMQGYEYTEQIKRQLVEHVRSEIGPIATPDVLHWAPGLPKTRSGKIMRRILRKIAENEFENLGDISTLAEPKVVLDLIQSRPQS